MTAPRVGSGYNPSVWCKGCGTPYPSENNLCPDCGMPAPHLTAKRRAHDERNAQQLALLQQEAAQQDHERGL